MRKVSNDGTDETVTLSVVFMQGYVDVNWGLVNPTERRDMWSLVAPLSEEA